MIEEKMIQDRIEALKKQREQAILTVNMIDGALQVLDGLLAEVANAAPEKSDLTSVG